MDKFVSLQGPEKLWHQCNETQLHKFTIVFPHHQFRITCEKVDDGAHYAITAFNTLSDVTSETNKRFDALLQHANSKHAGVSLMFDCFLNSNKDREKEMIVALEVGSLRWALAFDDFRVMHTKREFVDKAISEMNLTV